jgi:hypothetical protein
MARTKVNMDLYGSWKKSKISQDEKIKNELNLIAKPYGYIISDSFGLHVQKLEMDIRRPKYAEVSYTGWESFQISTVSSHWDISEATIYIKQLKEATECAAELNNYIKAIDYDLKREYQKEMEKLMESQG